MLETARPSKGEPHDSPHAALAHLRPCVACLGSSILGSASVPLGVSISREARALLSISGQRTVRANHT